ncbi:hypothetical protein [Actinomadura sediminis]|uniref:Tox-REase-5 domain-containing protein n=1 Tax=Actinomadura sediminis TaxID=1038904 RepID=A0ABW3EK61_9ACTN
MTRAPQAAAQLQHVRRLAEEHGPALKEAFALLQNGALVGPGGDRLHKTLAAAHHEVRSSLYAAFDAVQRIADEGGILPRVQAPYIPGAPAAAPRAASNVRSGSPAALNRLAGELLRAARSWRDASDALSRVLSGLGLSATTSRTISRAADRVAAQRTDIERRRDELLKSERQRLVHAAVTGAQLALTEKRGLTDVLGEAFDDTWNMYTGRYLAGVWEGTKDIGLTALAGNPITMPLYMGIDQESWLEHGPVGQAAGIYYGVQNPTEFAKAVVNWEGWKEDPVRAYGEAVPNAVMFALTGGTGSTSGIVAKIRKVVQRAHQKRAETKQSPTPEAEPQRPDPAQKAPDSSSSGQDAPSSGPQSPHPVLPRRPASPNEPHPALSPTELQDLENHLKGLQRRHPDKYVETKKDPDHSFKVRKGSEDEARVALDLAQRGIFDDGHSRPDGPDQGDFIDKGVHWDIKGIHSDWPPGVPEHIRSKPYRDGYNEEKFREMILRQFSRHRNVILDTRNADQRAIDDMKRIIEEEGWGDRIIWYP